VEDDGGIEVLRHCLRTAFIFFRPLDLLRAGRAANISFQDDTTLQSAPNMTVLGGGTYHHIVTVGSAEIEWGPIHFKVSTIFRHMNEV
jgi:hypothetical protein